MFGPLATKYGPLTIKCSNPESKNGKNDTVYAPLLSLLTASYALTSNRGCVLAVKSAHNESKHAVLAEEKSQMNFIAFEGEVGVRKVKTGGR